jgi:hypothetical protein
MIEAAPLRILRQWFLRATGSAGGPPYVVYGAVYGDPARPPGRRIITSAIVALAGRVVTTRSGTRYRLEEALSPAAASAQLDRLRRALQG